jgi:hypothetical protein
MILVKFKKFNFSQTQKCLYLWMEGVDWTSVGFMHE